MRWKFWTSKDEIPDPDTWGGNRNKSKGSGKGKGKELLVLRLASFYFGKRWIMKDSNIIVDFFKIQKLASNTSPRQKIDHGLFTTIFDSFSVGRWRIQHQHFLLHWFFQWKKWFGEPSFFPSPSQGNIQATKDGKANTFCRPTGRALPFYFRCALALGAWPTCFFKQRIQAKMWICLSCILDRLQEQPARSKPWETDVKTNRQYTSTVNNVFWSSDFAAVGFTNVGVLRPVARCCRCVLG